MKFYTSPNKSPTPWSIVLFQEISHIAKELVELILQVSHSSGMNLKEPFIIISRDTSVKEYQFSLSKVSNSKFILIVLPDDQKER